MAQMNHKFPARLLPLELVKWLCLVLAAAYLLQFSAGNRVSRRDFAAVRQAVLAAVPQDNLQEADNQMIKRLYGLDPAQYEGGLALYYPTSNMGAEELLLVRAKDRTQVEAVQQAIQARLAVQKKNFDGYGAEQTAMLNASQVVVRGRDILFVSAADPARAVQAFRKAL